MSTADLPEVGYAVAARAFAALANRDGAEISPEGRSRWYAHGARTREAVVLLHGLTSAPQQWDAFARASHAAGRTVVVPRLPGHGERDRSGRTLARVDADAWVATASDAVAIARGAADRVVVVGISLGGSLAAYLHRDAAVARAIAIAPLFGIRGLPPLLDRALAALLRAAPNAFVPWDPGGDGRQIPPYGYPRFPTRALAQALRVGFAVADARERAARADLTLVLNAREPAVANGVARRLGRRLAARLVVADDFPPVHDVIDPTNPFARSAVVYARVTAEIDRR